MGNLTRIAYEVADGVAIVSLNRPRKRNALDGETVSELAGVLQAAEEAHEVRVVLLRGEGPDFCAGADLAELERMAATSDPLENLDDAAALGQLFIRMRRLRRPIVGAVHGHALAGGAGLATACDMVVAAEDAVFGYPEVHLGFVPAMVMALLRRSVGEKAAFELVALGDRIGAAEAHRLGLVNRLFPAEGFDAAARDYARSLAGRSPSALALIKRLLYGMD
ncbi:MAG TPA: enoyl-CoA hydratase/isomerase family protein, partial [Longimicrobiales bacterium]|nr:enoyl-CoA hydratase/isomerase family protein [Longimicrobiales bacterium]